MLTSAMTALDATPEDNPPSGMHAVACLSGAAVLLAACPHIDTGNVLMDGLQGLLALGAGIILAGWWWCTCSPRQPRAARAGLAALAVAAVFASLSRLPQPLAVGVLAVLVIWALVNAARGSADARRFFAQRTPWNAAFFLLLVVANIGADAAQLITAPPGVLPAVSFVLGRVFTHIAVMAGTWIFLAIYDRWAAKSLRWLMTAVLIITPLLVVTDMILRLMWTKSIAQLCAEMELGRNTNFREVFEGAGVTLGPAQLGGALACLALCWAVFALCARLSRRAGWQASPWLFLKLGVASWIALVLVQAGQLATLAPEWRHWQTRASSLDLSPFPRRLGLVTFDVAFANPSPPLVATLTRKPDIFLFIVETLRADAVNPQVAPALTRLRDEHCQPLLDTRSAANATHLSWFGMLHGRLPVFWGEARKQATGSPLLRLLHDGGYDIEVRDGGTFDYLDMQSTNFGGAFTRVFEHIPNIDPQRKLSTPEREVRVFDRLRAAVAGSSPGGHVWLTGVDSSHYPYAWHEDWTPPFADADEHPVFPPLPSPQQIERIHHRYLNSVAWDDHMLGGFIGFLQKTGRFDESIIVVTGDHGEEFKEHGSWFHCSALNQEQTQVPLLIKWPKSWGRGATVEDASHLDITPSLLDALGVPEAVWSKLPGRSLRRAADATTIIATSQTGTRGEAMLWRRHGYEAVFSWDSPWLPVPPRRLWLERITGPDGPIRADSTDAYERELRRLYPDAFTRIFERCSRAP